MSAVLKPQTASAPTVKLLINGKFVESKTTIWKDVVNPATQEVLARVPFATKEELDAAIMGAAEAVWGLSTADMVILLVKSRRAGTFSAHVVSTL